MFVLVLTTLFCCVIVPEKDRIGNKVEFTKGQGMPGDTFIDRQDPKSFSAGYAAGVARRKSKS